MYNLSNLPQSRLVRLGTHFFGLLVLLVFISACGVGRSFWGAPPPPAPTATPTPVPTATPDTTDTDIGAASVAIPTPQVTIPDNFTPIIDERLDYSFAVPSSWSELDLRSPQIQRVAGLIGLGEQLEPLNTFLASPEGQVIGKIYITDITSALFGGLPSVLNVSVFAAPDLPAEAAASYVQEQIEASLAALGGTTTVSPVEAKVINNLPALESDATVDLTPMGIDNQAYARVVALLANDQVYLLTTLVPAGRRAAKADELQQIIGTFRPE